MAPAAVKEIFNGFLEKQVTQDRICYFIKVLLSVFLWKKFVMQPKSQTRINNLVFKKLFILYCICNVNREKSLVLSMRWFYKTTDLFHIFHIIL